MVFPASFLFASVMVAIGAMARSFKEAQNLLTPVYFLCFMPALVAGLGDYRLRGIAAVVPAVNVTLLARDLMLGQANVLTAMLVVVSTLIYGALALTLAARLYDSERLLYSDEGPVPLRAWLRRLLTGHAGPAADAAAAQQIPGPGHAITLFGIAYVLLFFVFIPLQARGLESGLLISQWVGMLGLVVVYARATAQPLRDVLGLRRPRARALLGALLIGLSAWAVLGVLIGWIAPAPDELVEKLRRIIAPTDGSRGLAVTLFLMAVTPAICEEALFRGAILRGFAARFSPTASAVLTGLLFGLYHVDVARLLPTAVLGIILSLVALRSRSIVPAMAIHLLNNASLILITHFGIEKSITHLGRPTEVGLFVGALTVLLVGAALVRQAGTPPPR
jgi:membrane protease YdiL (CAAX protease family)